MDFRFAKNIRFSRYRVQGQFDIYSAFNANSILAINTTYGAAWQRPLTILGARLLKFGAQSGF